MKTSLARALTAIGAVTTLSAVLAACGGGSANPSGGTVEGPVDIRLGGGWQTFDFQMDFPGSAGPLLTAGYDRLVSQAGDEVVPYLATKWEVTPTSATFTLRDDAKCADGTPVTPKVVADSFDRLFNEQPKRGVNLQALFGPGPYEVSADAAKSTVTITLGTPYSGLLSAAAQPESGIVCPAGLDNPKALQTKWFGSGAYELVSSRQGETAELRKRDDWTWGPVIDGEAVTADDLPDQLNWRVVGNETTSINLAVSGEFDILNLSGSDGDRLAPAGFEQHKVPTRVPYALTFNLTPNRPTSEQPLRAALIAAVDRDDMNQAVSQGRAEVADGWMMEFDPCYDPGVRDLYPTGGVDEAKQILSDAGYTGVGSKLAGPDGKPVVVRVVLEEGDAALGEYYLATWKKLGVDVKLSMVDGATVGTMLFAGDFEVSGTYTGRPPSTDLSVESWLFHGASLAKGGMNIFGPAPKQDPEFNETMLSATQSLEDCDAWQEAQREVFKKSIFLPAATRPWFVFTKNGVSAPPGATFLDPLQIRVAE